ncbi:MAG: DNA repair protein RecO [Candidatus Rokubacteria bacterium]|nr:DNA repair protein RecO [Candidatus Rokubacteria bacterium]
MPLLRTQGIVLRTRDLGEHDRLVTLYTRDLGKLTAVARGARRVRSRFGGALELFTWGEAVGFEREGRELVRLDHFDIRRSFRALREDLERLGHGARMVETLARLTAERDPHPACFTLLLRGLRALETAAAPRVHLAFTLRLLDLTGHRPRLDRCAGCHQRVAAGAAAFDPRAGGVVCGRCRTAGGLDVSGGALGVLRGLQTATWEARLRARIAAPTEREGAALLDAYVAELAGGPLRTARFLAQALSPF